MFKKIVPWFVLLYLSSGQALDLKGVSRFTTTFDLNFATAGVVKTIHVQPGGMVKQGDLLLELDDTPHQTRMTQAKAIEESLLPEVRVSEVEFERAQELFDRDSLSQVALQNAENKLLRAKGLHQSAQAETALKEYELLQTKLHAPQDAQILSLNINVGTYIDPAVTDRTVVLLADTRKISAVTTLTTEQWKSSFMNKPAIVNYRGKNHKANVTAVGYMKADKTTKQQTYELRVDFESTSPIPDGMPLTIVIK